MPFIMARVSLPISQEQERDMKSWLGKAIELVPGKSEASLLAGFEGSCHLYLRGRDSEPVAYVEAGIFGSEGHWGYNRLTAEITRMFGEIMGIAPDHVYVKYTDIPAWGVSGVLFDRNQFLQEG